MTLLVWRGYVWRVETLATTAGWIAWLENNHQTTGFGVGPDSAIVDLGNKLDRKKAS